MPAPDRSFQRGSHMYGWEERGECVRVCVRPRILRHRKQQRHMPRRQR